MPTSGPDDGGAPPDFQRWKQSVNFTVIVGTGEGWLDLQSRLQSQHASAKLQISAAVTLARTPADFHFWQIIAFIIGNNVQCLLEVWLFFTKTRQKRISNVSGTAAACEESLLAARRLQLKIRANISN